MTEAEYQDEVIVERGECPDCDSSDGLITRETHSHCYVCGNHTFFNTNRERTKPVVRMLHADTSIPNLDDTKVGPLTERNLTKETVKHYGVRLELNKQGIVVKHMYPYCSDDGTVIAYKEREVEGKKFRSHGAISKSMLFGQTLFPKGGKTLTLCEGEIDTMSAFQMQGSKYPHVGFKNAQSAYKDAKKHWEWINSFDEVYLSMDSDEAGVRAAKEVASLFPKKAKIVELQLKDNGEYLEKHREKEYVNLWWRATLYKPDDIISGYDRAFNILNAPRAEAAFDYPWEGLNKKTYGIRTGEMSTIIAGSGSGKTCVSREIAYNILKEHPDTNIGLLFLEETGWETTRGLVSLELDKPTHLPDTIVTEDELKAGTMATWGTDRVHTLSESWKENTVDYICDKISYFAKGLDCKFVVLDHISFMVSDNPGDERKMLDEIAHKLKALTVELDIHLSIVAHCKRVSGKPLEEGGKATLADIRGTAGIGQLSNMVYALERDGQNDDPITANTTTVRVVKNRFSGRTGIACYLYYDEFTGRLEEVEPKEDE